MNRRHSPGTLNALAAGAVQRDFVAPRRLGTLDEPGTGTDSIAGALAVLRSGRPSDRPAHPRPAPPPEPTADAEAPAPAPVSTLLAGPGVPQRAQRGRTLRARSWRAEGLLRMFENVLEVGENPDELIVYASLGKAARDWPQARAIARALLEVEEHQSLVLASGAAVGVLDTGDAAPLVLSAVNNTVGRWATPERFYERAEAGRTIWGGLTAGAWQYIGRQGVLAGTYELLGTIARVHFGASPGAEPEALDGRWVLTAGLGGMGSAQPISARMLRLSSLTVEADPAKAERLRLAGGLDRVTDNLDEALAAVTSADAPVAIGLIGNAADVFAEIARRGITPDIVTDQTAAHDARYGYLPQGYDLAGWQRARLEEPEQVERAARASIAGQVEAMLALADAGSVVFENGNNLRVQAIEHLGQDATERVNRIPGFMEALPAAAVRPGHRTVPLGLPVRCRSRTSGCSTTWSSRSSRTAPRSPAGSPWPGSSSRRRVCRPDPPGWATASVPSSRWRSTTWSPTAPWPRRCCSAATTWTRRR